MKKKVMALLLTISLSANAMVIVTWVITNAMGYDMISPTYLFRNIVAAIAIVGVNTILGWFYSRNVHPLIIGSLHFLLAAITFILCGLWANWFPSDGDIILTVILFFTVPFLVIWLFHYFYWKHQIKKLNSKLG